MKNKGLIGKTINYAKNNKLATVLLIFVLLLVVPGLLSSMFGGFSSGAGYEVESAMGGAQFAREMSLDSVPSESIKSSDAISTDRIIVHSADVDIEVVDADQALSSLTDIAIKYNGYASGSSIRRGRNYKSGYITLRVSKDNFQNAIDDISALGFVDHKSISADDVTEEFMDLSTRLSTYKATEQRYLELLDKATNVEELLMVEEQLGDIRYKIERIEGRFNYLQGKVDLSTIRIDFYEPEKMIPEIDFNEMVSDTVRNSIDGFFGSIQFIIVLLSSLAPWSVVVYIVWKFYKKRKEKKKR
ncbi:MAG: DUF4349 domain-containing protein [Candidatus Aenigmarchaeota archaeon]|nr:DUF4349 domain-containing protein [Candidatus Aenigmarchaeota archaeon]